MKLNYKANRHAVYSLKYHLVLTTKYRHKCINDELFDFIYEQTKRLLDIWKIELIEINHDKDHIHMLLEIPPQIQISKFINNYKTVTARLLKKNFEAYLKKYYWQDNFWNRSYLIISTGGAPIEVIREYIKDQGKKE